MCMRVINKAVFAWLTVFAWGIGRWIVVAFEYVVTCALPEIAQPARLRFQS